jgi:hypothetical protein
MRTRGGTRLRDSAPSSSAAPRYCTHGEQGRQEHGLEWSGGGARQASWQEEGQEAPGRLR